MNRNRHNFTAVSIAFLLVSISCERQGTVPKDLRTLPLAELRKLGDKGDAQAETLLGHRYFYGLGAAVDKAKGFRWYVKAAEQGYAEAQFFAGNCYGLGEGVSADQAQAEQWERRSANQGWPQAQARVGFNQLYLFSHGSSNAVDLVEAYKWLHLAATGGYQIEDFYASAMARQYLEQCRRQMTPEQIEEAKRRTRAFRPTKERPRGLAEQSRD